MAARLGGHDYQPELKVHTHSTRKNLSRSEKLEKPAEQLWRCLGKKVEEAQRHNPNPGTAPRTRFPKTATDLRVGDFFMPVDRNFEPSRKKM